MVCRRSMRGVVLLWVTLGLSVWGVGHASAETTLEKIGRTGVFTVGTRTASPPFGFINKQNEWVGFSIDLVKLVHATIEKKLGKSIKFELKESTPATRDRPPPAAPAVSSPAPRPTPPP